MRHSRAKQFDAELTRAVVGGAGRWIDVASDPNAAAALAHRAAVLRAAWRSPIRDRLGFLEERCRGRRVLDVGCVAHDVARMDSPLWLHGRLAAVSARCVGVDVLPDGIEAMRARNFHGVLHDLRDGLGPLAGEAPFDVIVAGELIEHVEAVDMLFRAARAALASEGELIVTTPNPYAPHRVRAAQLGIVWENTDHILYAFPSGIAELAERHGLVLAEAAVSDDVQRLGVLERLRALRRTLRGRQYLTVGYATSGRPRVRRVRYGTIRGMLHGLSWPGRRFRGETFVYVVRRSVEGRP